MTQVMSSFRLLPNVRVTVTPGSAFSSQSDLSNAMRTETQYATPLAKGKLRRSDLDKPAMWTGRNSTGEKLRVSSTAETLAGLRRFANVLN